MDASLNIHLASSQLCTQVGILIGSFTRTHLDSSQWCRTHIESFTIPHLASFNCVNTPSFFKVDSLPIEDNPSLKTSPVVKPLGAVKEQLAALSKVQYIPMISKQGGQLVETSARHTIYVFRFVPQMACSSTLAFSGSYEVPSICYSSNFTWGSYYIMIIISYSLLHKLLDQGCSFYIQSYPHQNPKCTCPTRHRHKMIYATLSCAIISLQRPAITTPLPPCGTSDSNYWLMPMNNKLAEEDKMARASLEVKPSVDNNWMKKIFL